MNNTHLKSFTVASLAFFLAACESEPTTLVQPVPVQDRGLSRAGSDSDFYAALREGLKSQSVGVQTDADEIFFLEADTTVVSASAPAESIGSVGAVSDTGISTSAGESSRNEVTSTNVQELGVDEQDWVKLASTGNELYVLESLFSDDIAFPVEPLPEITDVSSDLALSARTSIAVPQSHKTRVRVMGLDRETPDSSVLSELDVDLSGRFSEGFYLYENGDSSSLFLTSSGTDYWRYWGTSTAFSGVDSLITEVDVSNPSVPEIRSSIQFDGQIISSRRIGSHLFFASRYYPTLPGDQPWNQSPQDWAAQVDSADLSEVLPQYRIGDSDEAVSMVDPAECFVANSPQNDFASPDIITLGVIDLDTLQLTDSQCFLGASETLYASPDAVFLSTTRYNYSDTPFASDGSEIAVDSINFDVVGGWSDPRVDTDIHQFDIENGSLNYAGSGSVPGHLGWNPQRKAFRMSEKDGYLRVATINDRQAEDASPILFTVLQADGLGNLQTVAALPNDSQPAFIGKPGEQLYASRFLGDRGYLVTFRQTDPLYIIDLADPLNPSIAGELEIEGYSDYLQPIGENYLLGIGKDAVASNDARADERGALVQGVKLSLFDVSDASALSEVSSLLVGQRIRPSCDYHSAGYRYPSDANQLWHKRAR